MKKVFYAVVSGTQMGPFKTEKKAWRALLATSQPWGSDPTVSHDVRYVKGSMVYPVWEESKDED